MWLISLLVDSLDGQSIGRSVTWLWMGAVVRLVGVVCWVTRWLQEPDRLTGWLFDWLGNSWSSVENISRKGIDLEPSLIEILEETVDSTD